MPLTEEEAYEDWLSEQVLTRRTEALDLIEDPNAESRFHELLSELRGLGDKVADLEALRRESQDA